MDPASQKSYCLNDGRWMVVRLDVSTDDVVIHWFLPEWPEEHEDFVSALTEREEPSSTLVRSLPIPGPQSGLISSFESSLMAQTANWNRLILIRRAWNILLPLRKKKMGRRVKGRWGFDSLDVLLDNTHRACSWVGSSCSRTLRFSFTGIFEYRLFAPSSAVARARSSWRCAPWLPTHSVAICSQFGAILVLETSGLPSSPSPRHTDETTDTSFFIYFNRTSHGLLL